MKVISITIRSNGAPGAIAKFMAFCFVNRISVSMSGTNELTLLCVVQSELINQFNLAVDELTNGGITILGKEEIDALGSN